MWKQIGVVDHVLMCFQTNGQRRGPFGQQRAERIFVFLSMMRDLPKFHGTKRQW
jgi:hypothetical protein